MNAPHKFPAEGHRLRGALASIIADPDCCAVSKAIARDALTYHVNSASADDMSCAAHTPGPWEVDSNHVHQDGGPGRWLCIAKCDGLERHHPCNERGGYEIEVANARLIAAAPELLEALTRCANYAARYDDSAEVVRAANAAIAKARGAA